MLITNFTIKTSAKFFLFLEFQIRKIRVLCGIFFKTIRAIRVIRCFYFLEGLGILINNTNFAVLLCALCGSFSSGGVVCGF